MCNSPLSPNCDQHQIFHCDINAYSTPEFMRIKDMILITSLPYFYKKSIRTREENFFFDIRGKRVNSFVQDCVEKDTYMNMSDWQINVVQKFVMVLDRVARGKEHHDFLVSVFLEEGEQHEKTLL